MLGRLGEQPEAHKGSRPKSLHSVLVTAACIGAAAAQAAGAALPERGALLMFAFGGELNSNSLVEPIAMQAVERMTLTDA